MATALAAAFVVMALTAPVASAWTPENQGITVQGTITLKRGGIDPKTCSVTFGETFGGEVTGGDRFYAKGYKYPGAVMFPCVGGKSFVWRLQGDGFLQEGKQMMAIGSEGSTGVVEGTTNNPWGYASYTGTGLAKIAWTNATATTDSKIVLSEAKVGETPGGQIITASGTLSFRTNFGGKITLP